MTGFRSDIIKDAKPAIVVMIAKKDGFAFDKTVRSISSFWFSVLSFANSLYLTMRCKIIERVIINCKDTKFDEITVTSHPNIPKNPMVKTTETTETKIGIITNLSSLNITKSVAISIKSKIEP